VSLAAFASTQLVEIEETLALPFLLRVGNSKAVFVIALNILRAETFVVRRWQSVQKRRRTEVLLQVYYHQGDVIRTPRLYCLLSYLLSNFSESETFLPHLDDHL
jgi:hypothetical protein